LENCVEELLLTRGEDFWPLVTEPDVLGEKGMM